MRSIIYFVVGAAVLIAASVGVFHGIELFPWVFGFAWAFAGLLRVAFKWRSMRRAHIVLMVTGCVLAALAPVGQLAYFRVKHTQWERDALARFEANGRPPLEFAHVVNNDRRIWRGDSGYGGVTVVNFWATWCSPCMNELPLLEAFSMSHDPAVVRIVGFTRFYDAEDEAGRKEELARIELALQNKGVHYPSLVAIDEKTHDNYRVLGLPTTVVIDRNGHVVGYGIGEKGTKRLLQMADRLASQPKS